jgi:hypothetical protein
MPDPQVDIALAQLVFLQTLRMQREQEFAVKDRNHQPQQSRRTGAAASATPQAATSPKKPATSWPHHRRFWHRSVKSTPSEPQPLGAS